MPSTIRTAVAAVRRVVASPDMRRAALAWMLAWAAEWAWLVALFVFAFATGGLPTVGLVGLIRTLPAAVLAPALSSLTDRLPRHRLLLALHAGRAALLAAAALTVAADGPAPLVYAIAALDGLLAVLHRPTHMALLPALARSPEDLVAANAGSSTVEAIGILVGPAVGGVLVAVGIPALTFAMPAVLLAGAALSVAGIAPAQRLRQTEGRRGIWTTLLGGVGTLVRHRQAGLMVALFGSQTLVRGVLSVLIVVAAIDMLGLGEQGVGYLNAAIGAGGLIGAFFAMMLVTQARMAPWVLIGLVAWGAPIALMGLLPVPAVAFAALAAVGVGNAVLDVAGFSLLQRIVPNEVRGRVFGVLEALVMLTVGLGAIIGPPLVAALDVRGALVATGLVLPILALAAARMVLAADRLAVVPERELALLRAVPMFRVLPLTVLEQIAGDLVPVAFDRGATVMHQGDVADRFYVIADGELEVRVDDRVVRCMRVGESFGEVALLRDVRRTASVVAVTEIEAFALERDSFLAAVTGDRQSMDAAEAVVGERLAADPPLDHPPD